MVYLTTEQEKNQAIKDEKAAEKAFQATKSETVKVPGLTAEQKAAEQKKADDKVVACQKKLDESNAATAKAHDELMQAQKEAAQVK